MRIQLTRAAALVAGTLLFAVPGWAAEIQCGDHQSLTKHLADRFSELLSSTGIDARGRRIELYRSPSGSWTLVLVLEEGPACILSTGSNWAWGNYRHGGDVRYLTHDGRMPRSPGWWVTLTA